MGSIKVWADDTASVILGGVEVFPMNPVLDTFCAAGSIGCELGEFGLIDLSELAQGNHRLDFNVYQLGGGSFFLLYDGEVRQ